MKRWLPHPLMAALLLLAWLLLQQSLTPGTILVGLILAVFLSRQWQRLQPPRVRLRQLACLLALGARVFIDIVASNWAVARLILSHRAHASGFVAIDLELTQPAGLAVLAGIITATPGTIWISHDPDRRVLVIHVLDTASRETLVRNIKQYYERALLEVFGP